MPGKDNIMHSSNIYIKHWRSVQYEYNRVIA